MPTKRLPPNANLTHLKYQAKDLLKAFRAARASALQRVREFHPKLEGLDDATLAEAPFTLSDAQVSLAREYGYASWPRLKTVVAEASGAPLTLLHHERVDDPVFRTALDLMDEGATTRLSQHLAEHPDLIAQHVVFEGENYFTQPTLLEFIAENPVRHDAMSEAVLEVAELLLEAGAKHNAHAIAETLELVASGRVAREARQQSPLIDLLCRYGADPTEAMQAALAHGEFAAVERLLENGAKVDLVAAAALGRVEQASALLQSATAEEKHLALALAALHNRASIVRRLLSDGVDPNRYNPPGGHAHCTPLHSAALAGHRDTVEALVDGGARADIPDIHHQSTAEQWARFAGHADIAAFLFAQRD